MGREMHGVVSLPDEEHDTLIRDTWAAMEKEFGLAPVADTIVPHFTYHGAFDYNVDAVRERLRKRASQTHGFKARALSFAVFSGDDFVVIFAPLVRAEQLNALHGALWKELGDTAGEIVENYGPEFWLPHITLTPDGLDKSLIGELAAFFVRKPIDWEIDIDNVALLHDTGERQEVAEVFRFGGRS